jgi:hypothetical protein
VAVLRPTLKLAAQLALGPLADLAPTSDPHADWCVRSFAVGRVPYLLFSNTPSLFSIVVRRRGVIDQQTMLHVLGTSLWHYLSATGHGDFFAQRVAPQLHACTCARNRDRSIIGSMNDLAYLATAYLEPIELDFVEVHRRLNSAPMGALHMNTPFKVFTAMGASESN